jgi:hypothetical protein
MRADFRAGANRFLFRDANPARPSVEPTPGYLPQKGIPPLRGSGDGDIAGYLRSPTLQATSGPDDGVFTFHAALAAPAPELLTSGRV